MNPDFTKIKNIVFDLGKVLLNLDFNATIQAFIKLDSRLKNIEVSQFYQDPIFKKLETGSCTAINFRNRIRQLMDNPQITDEEINGAWCAMLLDIPIHRITLLKQLKKKFNIYLFSNTNEIHIDFLHKKFKNQYGFNFSSLFIKDFYSHELHARKPDLFAFKKVIKLSKINPCDTLFIDDLEKNISSAKESGLQTFWLKNNMEVLNVFK